MRRPFLLKILVVATLLAVAVPGHVAPALGVVYVPGVKVGGFWDYGHVQGFCASPCPPGFASVFNVTGVTNIVNAVSGSNVTVTTVISYANGTTTREVLSGNLQTGAGNITDGFPLIAAGLGPGMTVINSPSAPRINYTTIRTYAGVARQVDVLNLTISFPAGPAHVVMFWDQVTGILAEVSLSSATLAASYKLVSTNVFSGPPDFTITANPDILTIGPAGTGSFFTPPLISLNSVNNFTGQVTLHAVVGPPGLAVELGLFSNSSTTILTLKPNGQNGTLLIPELTPSTPPGTYFVSVTGVNGAIAHSVNVTIIVQGSTSDFTMSANPGILRIAPGTNATSIIAVKSLNGFVGTVFLSTTSPPLCAEPICSSWSISPTSVNLAANGTAAATLSIYQGTGTLGSETITVFGASRGINHSVSVIVEPIAPPPDFGLLLTAPPNGGSVIVGQATTLGVGIFTLGQGVFNGVVTLTGQIFPIVSNGPTLSFSPNQLSLVSPGPSSSTLTISTTTTTPTGNYTITITASSGTLVHTAQVHLTVLPPPVLTITPSSGRVGSLVTVHGSNFPGQSEGPFAFPVEVVVTFDNQFLGFTFLQNNAFSFSFNVPVSQATLHHIHAIEQRFPNAALDVEANFTVLPKPADLSVSISVGSIYFPEDTVTIFVMTSLNGQPATVSSLQLFLISPTGSNTTLTATRVATGVYRATFSVPSTGPIGTYAVVAKAHQPGAQDASGLASFEVKLSWLSSNSSRVAMATGIAGAVGIASVLGLAWRRGYFARRKDEYPGP